MHLLPTLLHAYKKQFPEQCISQKANLLGCGTGWDEIRWGGPDRGRREEGKEGGKRREEETRTG